MAKIVYLGLKPQKADNVAQTGLVWTRGQVHEVEDAKKAEKLLEHKDIWADADKRYRLIEPADAGKAPVPTVTIIVPGARFVTEHTPEVTAQIARGELVAVFMTIADAKAFEEWKESERDTAPEKAPAAAPVEGDTDTAEGERSAVVHDANAGSEGNREEDEREGILRALQACAANRPMVIVPAATTGSRTAYHVLSAREEFPESLRGGKTESRRFWRHVEALRHEGKISETEHRKPDGHKITQFIPVETGRVR